MPDVNSARGDAKAAVMEQHKHCCLKRNKNITYNHNKITKVELTVNRVLKEIYNDKEDGQGMIKLMASKANNINTVKTNKVVTWNAVILQAL